VNVDPTRHIDPDELPPEKAPLKHEPRGHHSVAENPLLVVDVPEKEIEGRDALDEPFLDPPPLGRRDDSRHRIHRPDPLDALLRTVDREPYAVLPHRKVGHRLALAEVVGRCLGQPLTERGVVGSRPVGRGKHLVVGQAEFVAGEHRFLRSRRPRGIDGGVR
jgi:hypothetical protein